MTPVAAPRQSALADAVADVLAPSAPAALVVLPEGVAVATARGTAVVPGATAGSAARLRAWEDLRPRWVWWSARSVVPGLLAVDPALRLRRCWDLAAVHRLLHGGSKDDAGRVWAAAHGLDPGRVPRPGQLDLLSQDGDTVLDLHDRNADGEPALRPDGYLRADWADGGWAADLQRAARWAQLALQVQVLQAAALKRLSTTTAEGSRWPSGNALHTAWSESAAELLATELAADGLPVDVPTAETVIGSFAGPRPSDPADAAHLRTARDAQVLAHAPGHGSVDLRSPAQVKTLLADLGLDVPDTRSWRLERLRTAHPLVQELLAWRQAERFVSTYGYRWLDEHVGPDGRLRGGWSGSDGGAGRMTAQAGLHSMPRELRVAVRAEPGTALVRADLGQVEPRVLAAVSGDQALAGAAQEDDLYAPVAKRLGCERAVAKVAVLAAMYGQTSGTAGEALKGLERSYPVAMAYLADAHARGQSGQDVRTFGGRRVPVWKIETVAPEAGQAAVRTYRSALAARGRFARNAVVQGAAAELFKAWAATVRSRLAGAEGDDAPRPPLGQVVLCLHDELLLQVRADAAEEVALGIVDDLTATASRWCAPGARVRFVADVSVVESWADAKA
jgi:DNA polymerase I